MLLGLAASSDQTAQAEPEPRYDSATTVDMMTLVADLREVPRGNPLNGTHLLVRPESAKENSETIDVYLGPANGASIRDESFRGFSHTMAYNVAGRPTTVVRCGESAEGLPIAVQVVAAPWREEIALAVAAGLEQEFGGWKAPKTL